MKLPTRAMDVKAETEKPFPEPFKSILGKTDLRRLGRHFELSQFAVNLEVIYPGAQSALRHWHTASDEFVYMLEGELTLVTDGGEILVQPGMCVGFQSGDPNGHHFINRSEYVAKFLVIGASVKGDEVYYPDDDIQWLQKDGRFTAARKDGVPYE
jgi:uncharacterized cupin superfamily protein